MKRKIMTTALLAVLFTSASAQMNRERNGYIGINIGPSFPTGELKADGLAKTGLNLSLINFGYVISNNVGIAAKLVGQLSPNR